MTLVRAGSVASPVLGRIAERLRPVEVMLPFASCPIVVPPTLVSWFSPLVAAVVPEPRPVQA